MSKLTNVRDEKELNKRCLAELQLAVIKTLLNIMHDKSGMSTTTERLKAAELLTKVSPTIFKESAHLRGEGDGRRGRPAHVDHVQPHAEALDHGLGGFLGAHVARQKVQRVRLAHPSTPMLKA